MLHVYGIKNCNSVKKALTWLEENSKEYTFHDYKKEPAAETKLKQWAKQVSWEPLVNRKGTSWRKLTKEEQEDVTDADAAYKVLLENNSLIKRPIVEYPDGVLVGFDETEYTKKLT